MTRTGQTRQLHNAHNNNCSLDHRPNRQCSTQPRETMESAHQSQPTNATQPVTNQTSEQPTQPTRDGRDRIGPNLIWPTLFGRIWQPFCLTEFGQTAFGQFFFGGVVGCSFVGVLWGCCWGSDQLWLHQFGPIRFGPTCFAGQFWPVRFWPTNQGLTCVELICLDFLLFFLHCLDFCC